MALPKYFKSILWFSDINNLSLNKDKKTILFQALEKGQMEHLNYLADKLGKEAIYKFARHYSKKFSRKSIPAFAKALFHAK